ncbi:hypothetical protein [Bradyrhizobium sp. BWA-3-5]|uniref:hypothetical protein n=1 Tax=Bradyrhizobium sp. BWA-3-5 TaxID=3080013 RepID=UPI00293F3EDE|nr:hypothetical protein [Bradyrhizobium sp. BWA-3-5]WOH68182.1 hypothetical protein RX331_10875 [Bradyrhizobium sp. BWA-3-5]
MRSLDVPPARASNSSAVSRLRLLLLCDFPKRTASTITDHILALREFSQHSITVFNSKGEGVSRLELGRFDGIIIHYSLVVCMDSYVGPKARAAIRAFPGLKIAFVQDDYRWIDQTVDALRDLGIHVLFGLVPSDIIDQVYSPEKLPGVIRETVLAGYVPYELTKLKVRPFKERVLDVGYRARKLPAWLGSFAQEKWLIAERFQESAGRYGLRCDLSTREEDRIYGGDWVKFLSDCKAVLGTESGSSVCDFTGEIQRKVESHLAAHPNVSFETLRELYFNDEDGRIVLSVISPRCFEAAALRTLMILYEGSYSGRLQAWRHYVPLKKDHSNMAEVVEVLRDEARAQAIIDTAFREVALNPDNSFTAMVCQVDRAINQAFRPEMARKRLPYSEGELDALLRKERRRQFTRKLYVYARRCLQLAAIRIK